MQQNHLFISNSKSSSYYEVIKFLRSLTLLVLLPSLIGIFFIEGIAWRVGVTISPQILADAQNKDQNVLAISGDGFKYYAAQKLARIAKDNPEIIFIGTSRCSQIRSSMFKPYTMYNACLTAWTINQIREMLERIIKVAHPKIVIFTLDYYMFTDEYEAVWATKAEQKFTYTFRSHLNGLIRLGEAFKASPWKMFADLQACLLHDKRGTVDRLKLLGFDSMRAEAGFRYDGSFVYDAGTRAAANIHNKDRLYGLLNAVTGAPRMSLNQIVALKKLAKTGKEHGITLVGIQLPILSATVNFLETDKSYWPYSGVWRQFQSKQTVRMFKDLGVYYFDMSHDSMSTNPNNFIDAAHVTEHGLLAAIIHQLNNPNFLSVFSKMKKNTLRMDYLDSERRGEFFDVYHDRF